MDEEKQITAGRQAMEWLINSGLVVVVFVLFLVHPLLGAAVIVAALLALAVCLYARGGGTTEEKDEHQDGLPL